MWGYILKGAMWVATAIGLGTGAETVWNTVTGTTTTTTTGPAPQGNGAATQGWLGNVGNSSGSLFKRPLFWLAAGILLAVFWPRIKKVLFKD